MWLLLLADGVTCDCVLADGYILSEKTPVIDGYIIALWWAIGNVCGQGAPIDPENMPERGFTIVVYVAGTIFFAYIIAMVTEELNAYVNDPTNKAMDELATFCAFHHITKKNGSGLGVDLEHRLKDYYANYVPPQGPEPRSFPMPLKDLRSSACGGSWRPSRTQTRRPS